MQTTAQNDATNYVSTADRRGAFRPLHATLRNATLLLTPTVLHIVRPTLVVPHVGTPYMFHACPVYVLRARPYCLARSHLR